MGGKLESSAPSSESSEEVTIGLDYATDAAIHTATYPSLSERDRGTEAHLCVCVSASQAGT